VLGYRPRRGDETFRARDEDDYAADIAAGRINVGAHDSNDNEGGDANDEGGDANDEGDAGNNPATKCAASNTGRHFVQLGHNNDRGGAGHRCSHRWLTAARIRHARPVVAEPRIGHTGG
jgi:hypothetical protein